MRPTILITGGTGKLGRRFVQHFSQQQWRVIFTSTDASRASELINSLGERAEAVDAFITDLTAPGAAVELVKAVLSKGYTVNHLVNNARSLSSLKTNTLGQTDREDFMAEYLLGVVAPYELSMALSNQASEHLETITNIGSQYGVVAANPSLYEDYPHQAPIQYGVTKSAVMHLTKELAVRLSEGGVRVNCIAYGGVEGRVDESFKARYARLSPSRRMLSESEVVGPLELLMHSGSSAITGQTIIADGGWTLW